MRSGIVVSVEAWNVEGHKAGSKKSRVNIEKVAVRDYNGRFHGVTNVAGTIRGIIS